MTPRIVIVGSGPAGISAALTIAHEGLIPIVIDAQPRSGGQIWRGSPSADLHLDFNRLVETKKIDFRTNATVVDAHDQTLIATTGRFAWDRLILATGARELFLPFPGWTLGGVMGAGGLQAAYKSGLQVKGKRILLAGSGPLLLAVASALLDAGAHVLAICEQAPRLPVAAFGLQTALLYGKLGQALALARQTALLFRPATWITEVKEEAGLHFRLNTDDRWQSADYIGAAFGLIPNLELPRLLGCDIQIGAIRTDQDLRTSRSGIWAAGETSGIGGVDAALAEGRLAARSALGLSTELDRAPVQRWRAYQSDMEHAYRLRSEVKALARPETLICRCEAVPYGDLKDAKDPTEAKLDLRLGMGWCQGRICGAACQALFNWPEPSVRPPLFPIPAAQYANLLSDHDES